MQLRPLTRIGVVCILVSTIYYTEQSQITIQTTNPMDPITNFERSLEYM